MSTPGIQSVLQQMQTLSSQATGGPEKGNNVATAVGKGGFADELQASIERINELQVRSGNQTDAFEAGATDLSLNQVMVDNQKAGLAFDAGIQVRNRLVGAYKDIMNMRI